MTTNAKWFILGLVMSTLMLATGCTTASVKNTTKDGRVFEASVTSCVWDRQIKGLKFDYERGTLEVQTFNSSTDKETAGKALDAATSALNLATKLAL